MGHTLKKNENCFHSDHTHFHEGKHSFLSILGLERGLKILNQIFLTKMGMSHILRKNYNCLNAENVRLHHENSCFDRFCPNWGIPGYLLGPNSIFKILGLLFIPIWPWAIL